MGDPKKLKKKYSTPVHPWNKKTIEEEKVLKRDYGLKIKKEILIANSFLKKYKNIAKKLISNQTAQGIKEKKQMMEKLQRLGLIIAGAELDDVLSLELKDILERRIQSIVFRKGLARTMKQARQFIVHRHVMIGEKEITSPSYLLSTEEESKINFKERSTLASEDHPERVNEAKEVHQEAEKVRNNVDEKAEEPKVAEVKKAEEKVGGDQK